MSADKSRLATFSSDGTARVWDIGSALLSEATSYESWSAPNPLWSGLDAGAGRIAVWVGGHRADSKWQTIVFDTATGEAEMTVPGGPAALSPDGTLLAYRPVTSRSDGGRMMGDVLVVEVDSGEVVAEFDAPCNASFVGGATVGGDGCFGRVDAPEHTRTWQLAFSPAGDLLSMVDGVDTTLMVWDLSTGETVISDRIEGRYPGQVEFRPDGAISVTLFGSLGGGGTRIVHDLTSYTVISEEVLPGGAMGWRFTPDQSLLITHGFSGDLAYGDGADFSLIDRVQAHQGFVSHIAISPNGTMIASASDDGVRVWNIADRSLLSDLGFTGADVRWLHFLDDRRLLLVAPFTESVIVVALDAADLAAAGKAKVTRAFTETECLTYAIDPCPTTLEELRGG
jgi:WD40 repeat protein